MRFLLFVAFISLNGAFFSCNDAVETVEKENTPPSESVAISEENPIEPVENTTETKKDTEVIAFEKKETPTKSETPSERIVEERTTPSTVKTSNGRSPKIAFQSKIFDYGMIAQGDKVSHQFSFTNVGGSDLIIKNAEASCGCTKPSYPFMPIAPGESGVISVTFSSVGKMGTQKPTITVTSNSSPAVQTLQLTGYVTDKLDRNILESDGTLNAEENVTKGGDVIIEDNH